MAVDHTLLDGEHYGKAHAGKHVNGDDDIQDATASQKGLMTAAQASKLDGIEAGADVTDATNVAAAGAVMKSAFDAYTILAATVDDTPITVNVAEGTLVGRLTGGAIAALSASDVRTLLGLVIGTNVQAYSSNLTTWAGKTAPSGTVVGTSDTQTLSAKTLEGVTLNSGYTEGSYAVSGTAPALSPNNGSIQTWTLSGNSTPTSGTWASGQSITLHVDDGSAYSVTWTSIGVVWKTNGGSPPTLNTDSYTTIELWKIGSTIFGARVGDA